MKVVIDITENAQGNVEFELKMVEPPKTRLEVDYTRAFRVLAIEGIQVIGKKLKADACIVSEGNLSRQ